MSEPMRVFLVGHCTADFMFLSRFVRKQLPEASVERVNTDGELDAVIAEPAVLLVNRVLDGSFRDSSGMAVVVRSLAGGSVPLLISNYEDAQQQAVEAGATPGFGKGELGEAMAADRLQQAMAQLSRM